MVKTLEANKGSKAMKTHFRFQFILTVSLFYVIAFNANAQTDYSFDHPLKSESDHSKFLRERFEQNNLFDNVAPQKFLKIVLMEICWTV